MPRWFKFCVALIIVAAWLFCMALACRAADAPPMPNADAPPSPVAALTLKAPATVPAGSGYIKVRATAASAVSFDVEAQFEEDVTFQYEQLDQYTLLVGVPASAGVIRIEAAVSVAGAAPVFAKAFIEVVAVKKKEPPVTPATKPPGLAVGKLFAVLVVSKADPSTQFAASPTLKKSIEDLGDVPSVLDAAAPAIAAQGLAKFLADAGGAPALILMDAAGDVHKAVKLPADEAAVLALIKDTHAGK